MRLSAIRRVLVFVARLTLKSVRQHPKLAWVHALLRRNHACARRFQGGMKPHHRHVAVATLAALILLIVATVAARADGYTRESQTLQALRTSATASVRTLPGPANQGVFQAVARP